MKGRAASGLGLALALAWIGTGATAQEPAKAPKAEDAKPAAAAPATAGDELTRPQPGSPEAALLEGLTLIEARQYDAWIAKLCHPDELCRGSQTKSIQTYNLPAVQRIAHHCIRGTGRDALKITRVDDTRRAEGRVRIFIECNPQGMPRPFHLQQHNGAWKFSKI